MRDLKQLLKAIWDRSDQLKATIDPHVHMSACPHVRTLPAHLAHLSVQLHRHWRPHPTEQPTAITITVTITTTARILIQDKVWCTAIDKSRNLSPKCNYHKHAKRLGQLQNANCSWSWSWCCTQIKKFTKLTHKLSIQIDSFGFIEWGLKMETARSREGEKGIAIAKTV